MIGQPHVHVLVPVAEAVLGERVGLKSPAHEERGCCEEREADDGADHERPHRVPGHAPPDPGREAPGVERRAPIAGASGIRVGGVADPSRRAVCCLTATIMQGFPYRVRGKLVRVPVIVLLSGRDSRGPRGVSRHRGGARDMVGPISGRRRRGGGRRAHSRARVHQEPARRRGAHGARADARARGPRWLPGQSWAFWRSRSVRATRLPGSTRPRRDGPRATAPRRRHRVLQESRTSHPPRACS